MTIKDYINETIDKHEKQFGLLFIRDVRIDIEKYINEGIYAFQFIYKYRHRTKRPRQLVSEIKKLDQKLCVHESSINPNGTMWSYDGGKRYQWSEMETLVFDSSLIRDIKLEKLLNDNN